MDKMTYIVTAIFTHANDIHAHNIPFMSLNNAINTAVSCICLLDEYRDNVMTKIEYDDILNTFSMEITRTDDPNIKYIVSEFPQY